MSGLSNNSMESPVKIAVLLLAAGSSERMGEANKLLLPVRGEEMLRHALRSATGCGANSVHLLSGYQRDQVLAVAESFPVSEIYNPDFAQGQDMSIAVGMRALQSLQCSVLVLLADQPNVRPEMLETMMRAHRLDGGQRALVPVFRGQRGTPRILPSAVVTQAAAGVGRFSIRAALSSGRIGTQFLEVADDAVLKDVDTPEQYRQLLQSN